MEDEPNQNKINIDKEIKKQEEKNEKKKVKEKMVFTIDENNLLGKGSFGKIFAGYNKKTGEEVNIKEILDDNILLDDQNRSIIRFRAYFDYINHTEKNYYPGCLDCKKKLSQDNEGWMCQTCNKRFNEPKYYYTLSFRVRDITGECWVEMYGDVASKFLGINVDNYKDIIVNNDLSKINEINEKIDFKEFIFVGKVRISNFNNVSKKKISVFRSEEINQKSESEKLIKFFSTIFI